MSTTWKPFNREGLFQLREHSEGISLHIARRFLRRHTGGDIPFIVRGFIINIIMGNVFLVQDSKKADLWKFQFEASLNLMLAASFASPKAFNEVFEHMEIGQLQFQSNLHFSLADVEQSEVKNVELRARVQKLNNAYKDLYDGAYKCVSSAVVLSKKILNKKGIPCDHYNFVHDDPNSKIDELLSDDDNECVPPLPELCHGCDRHLRNAIAHNRWHLKLNRVEYWDFNPHSKKETWRKTYALFELQEAVEELKKTVEALTLAVVLRKILANKDVTGFFSLAPGEYELHTIQLVFRDLAYGFGFYLNDVFVESPVQHLFLDLYVLEPMVHEQVTTIFEGSNPPRCYKVPVCVFAQNVFDMLMNFLLITGHALESYNITTIRVSDRGTKIELGEFAVTKQQISSFLAGSRTTLEDVFESLRKHSMKISVEGMPLLDYGDNADIDKIVLASAKLQLGNMTRRMK